MIKFRDPKKALLEMVTKLERERPVSRSFSSLHHSSSPPLTHVSRLLKETGRFTNSPVFVVGIYSGADEIGQGFGSSLKMAEFRAAEDALHRVYLTRTPNHLLSLPTSTFPLGFGDVFTQGDENPYTPPDLVMPEVTYASSSQRSSSKP